MVVRKFRLFAYLKSLIYRGSPKITILLNYKSGQECNQELEEVRVQLENTVIKKVIEEKISKYPGIIF